MSKYVDSDNVKHKENVFCNLNHVDFLATKSLHITVLVTMTKNCKKTHGVISWCYIFKNTLLFYARGTS